MNRRAFLLSLLPAALSLIPRVPPPPDDNLHLGWRVYERGPRGNRWVRYTRVGDTLVEWTLPPKVPLDTK